MISPEISVLMCAHNEEKFIRQALVSVLVEKDINMEVVVVNDRSTDDTKSILDEIQRNDPRLKIITRTNNKEDENITKNIFYAKDHGHGGQTDALNLGLKHCYGKYIARQDADDVSMEGRFKKQLQYMEQNPEIDFLGSSAIRIDYNGDVFGLYHSNTLDHKQIVSNLKKFRPYAPHSSWFVKRSIYEALNGYDFLGYRAEDFDFLLRVSEMHNAKFAFINVPLIYLRMHPGSLSSSSSLKAAEYAINAFVRHCLRMKGYYDKQLLRTEIFRMIRNESIKVKLERKIFAYNELRNSYIEIKRGKFVRPIFRILKSVTLSPAVTINYRILSELKEEIALNVCDEYSRMHALGN